MVQSLVTQKTLEQIQERLRLSDSDAAQRIPPPGQRELARALRLALQGLKYFQHRSYAKALDVLPGARQVFERYGRNEQIALCLFCEGASLVNLQRWEQGAERLAQAAAHRDVLGNELFGDLLGYWGIALHNLARHNEAALRLREARDIAQRQSNTRSLAFVLGIHEAASLLVLHRSQDALEVYEQVNPPPSNASSQETQVFYQDWTRSLVEAGILALQEGRLWDMEPLAKKLANLEEEARRQGAKEVEMTLESMRGLVQQDAALLHDFDEFRLVARLSSIRDPWEAWETIGKEVSKRWPEGVSAVDAIREQRR